MASQTKRILLDSATGFNGSSSRTLANESLEGQDSESRHVWKNKSQHLFYFLGYCVNIRGIFSLIYEDRTFNPDKVPSLLQVIVMAIIFGGPLLFIQHFIGQFTQKGCTSIGLMLPAMYGFGFTMLLGGLLDTVINAYYAGGALMLIFISLVNFPVPPWMICPNKITTSGKTCVSIKDIDSCSSCFIKNALPCFDSNKSELSTRQYLLINVFQVDFTPRDLWHIGVPGLKMAIHVLLCIILVYIVSIKKFKSLDWSLRLSLILCFILSLVSLAVVFAYPGPLTGIQSFFEFSYMSLMNWKSWAVSFRRVTDTLNIPHGGNVLLGSYMTMDTASHFRVCYLIVYFIVVITYIYFHYHLIEGHLRCRLNQKNYGVEGAASTMFVMYGTEYGLSAFPQLWSTIHFVIIWVLLIVSLVMNIVLVDETLSEEFKIKNYNKYTKFALCVGIYLLCLPCMTPPGILIIKQINQELKLANLIIITMMFFIFFLYNLQRLNDDIHFVLNVPPTWYVQTCWMLTFIFSIAFFIYRVVNYKSDNTYWVITLIIYLLLGAPVLIGFLIKMIQYMKIKNITGLFRPSIYYGSPDMRTRMLRLLYNPRLEVRYRRRKEVCTHRCLLNSEIAMKAIDRELGLFDQVANDLQNTEGYKGEYSDIIKHLEEHQFVMRARFANLTQQFNMNTKMAE